MGRQPLAARLAPSARLEAVVALVRAHPSRRAQVRAAHRRRRSHAARARDDETTGELRSRVACRAFLRRARNPRWSPGASAGNRCRSGCFLASICWPEYRGRSALPGEGGPAVDRRTTMSIKRKAFDAHGPAAEVGAGALATRFSGNGCPSNIAKTLPRRLSNM